MSDDIYNFIINKKELLKENENFNKWNETNKLKDNDGSPLIAFHGSTQPMFNAIENDKLSNESYFFGGFYLSSSVSDVNDNYARAGIDLQNTAATLAEWSSDFYDFEILLENQFPENSFSDKEIELIEEIYEDEELLTVGYLMEKFDNFDYEHIKEMLSQFTQKNIDMDNKDEELDLSDLNLILLIEKKYKTQGWVAPFVVKMENPCYAGFGNKDTVFAFSSHDSETLQEQEEMYTEEYPAYEDAMNAIKEIYQSEGLNPTDFRTNLEEELSSCSGLGSISLIYQAAINSLEENYNYKEEDAQKIAMKAFNEQASDYISFDEENEVENDEELYIPDFDKLNGDFLEEKYQRGEDLLTAFRDHFSDMSLIDEEIQNHFDEDLNIEDIRNIVSSFIGDDDDKEAFNNALSSQFDGVVMNAYETNKKQWNNSFDLKPNTIHYIVFKENNVKSALSNKSFSLYDDDFVQRKTINSIKKDLVLESKSVVEKHLIHLESKWINMPKVSLIDGEKFDDKNTDAMFSRKENEIFVNKDRMDSIETLEKTLIHETVVHYGLHKFFPNEITGLLEKVSDKYKKEIEDIRSENYSHLDPEKDRLKLAEEFVAFHAEKLLPNDSFLKRVKKQMKKMYADFKRTLGFETTIAEDMNEMLFKTEELIKDSKVKKKKNIKPRF